MANKMLAAALQGKATLVKRGMVCGNNMKVITS